ncbi:DUF4189 domain-containing protein [Gordonia amarae]|nr:DUF4189 domain-containing protein [Gordonia amarae]MCS3877145.1 hypothetical protein [Gordonia amarae]QHN15934.1 DUF4189 domain-containing protein [Gordonia amarae]QHN20502.1 DUF4189 domain-containing protein [Gordonia amarae]QHN29354.1 DUF4189 domain-containing protein [Gordonia amarae]QHN38133.1 DUF4189 domain-containing protein [Gordonia amarae]
MNLLRRKSAAVRAGLATMAVGMAATGLIAAAPGEADARPGHWYGAIAISMRTGNAAVAVDYPTVASARRAAIRKCRAYDCKWAVTMDNNCGAAAQNPYTRRWGYAYAPTRFRAEQLARREARGGRTIVWGCTTRPRY